jgi:putrescine oxidase
MKELTRDVVVIGAGASGLTVANDLRAAGRSVVVLEARDRVGGRLWTREIEGAVLELGGQWVSPDQSALIDTLQELGLQTFSRYRDGASVYIDEDGARAVFRDDLFALPESTQNEITALIATLDALVAELDVDRPWDHPSAAELDSISWTAWLEAHTADARAQRVVSMFAAEAMLTKPAHAFSALQALHMAASAGSFSHLVDEGFMLDKRVVGGLQQVPLRLAERLGSDVVLNSPVLRVEHGTESVTVVSREAVVHAQHVVVAVPPNLYGRIAFNPPLPADRAQGHQHLSLGLVIKVHAVYSRPFWRDNGLSGTAFSPYVVVHEAYDNSNYGDERGTLVGFVSDTRADALLRLDADARRDAILAALAGYYGDEALRPEVYYESDWASEEWTRGAYATSFDLGGLSRFGSELGDAIGRIHWSASDLAGAGFQHVDGAIRRGHRVANEILASKENGRIDTLAD